MELIANSVEHNAAFGTVCVGHQYLHTDVSVGVAIMTDEGS